MISAQVLTYLLEAAAIALVSRYLLGRSPLDYSVMVLLVIVAVSHIVTDALCVSRCPVTGSPKEAVGGGHDDANEIANGIANATTVPTINGSNDQLPQVNVIKRFTDDRMALDYHVNNSPLSMNEEEVRGFDHEEIYSYAV